MMRRVNLALMETVLAERRRLQQQVHPLAEYVSDWSRAHTLSIGEPVEQERSFTVSLNGRED